MWAPHTQKILPHKHATSAKNLISPATSAFNGQRRSTLTAYPILHQYLFFRPRIEPENTSSPYVLLA